MYLVIFYGCNEYSNNLNRQGKCNQNHVTDSMVCNFSYSDFSGKFLAPYRQKSKRKKEFYPS
jgi:hypothetical protein